MIKADQDNLDERDYLCLRVETQIPAVGSRVSVWFPSMPVVLLASPKTILGKWIK
jgi:hypothetical protein